MQLVEFLRARLDEDEAVARAAELWTDFIAALAGGPLSSFGAHHNPDRVLAEVEAKRQIVELVKSPDAEYPDFDGGFQTAWEETLQLLALPYADHPDYNSTWRP